MFNLGVLGEQNLFWRRSGVVEMGGPHFSQKTREMGPGQRIESMIRLGPASSA
jgi:hypothetical protein